MYCPACGSQIVVEGRFCMACGEALPTPGPPLPQPELRLSPERARQPAFEESPSGARRPIGPLVVCIAGLIVAVAAASVVWATRALTNAHPAPPNIGSPFAAAEPLRLAPGPLAA